LERNQADAISSKIGVVSPSSNPLPSGRPAGTASAGAPEAAAGGAAVRSAGVLGANSPSDPAVEGSWTGVAGKEGVGAAAAGIDAGGIEAGGAGGVA
jgi:hypothetical protein